LKRALVEAQEQPGPGLDKVLTFTRAATGHDRPIAAIAAEFDLLPTDALDEIGREQRAAFDALATLIRDGMADGSIRDCDADMASRTIWGMVSWTPLGELWAGRTGDNLADRMDAGLPTLIERGISSSPINAKRALVTKDLLRQLIASRPDDRVEEIARVASSLFNRRGIDGVSLDDVAAEMEATKGLLYHHFSSKAALVRQCFERGFEIYRLIMSMADNCETGIEQARQTVGLNTMAQLQSLHPMSLSAAYRQLPPEELARFTAATSELLDRSVVIARRGMRDGSMREFDATAVALSSAGSFLFLGRWMPDKATLDPVIIGREVTDLYLYGLRAEQRGAFAIMLS